MTGVAAIYFSEKKVNLTYSFGYERYEVLAAFANSPPIGAACVCTGGERVSACACAREVGA